MSKPPPEGTPMEDSERVMRDIADRYPELSDFGFGVYDPRSKSPKQQQSELEKNRAYLFQPSSLVAFDVCRVWLRQWPRTKHVNPSAGTSYGLKHQAEKDIGYITNGVFIASAIAEGLTVKRIPDSPNAWVNLSARVSTPPWLRRRRLVLA